ncbi:hypothetical protein GUJ93_ZPchr0004g38159 [Zizania palustris]|uniref:Uncharacterized protein n=1 Tax=Zizania palustris TaxID=103762 RepID=A0A8J5VZ36_ZIZPA|nr:hypothetical protein GUJ93_ZPchr0004g38159 [Zizania palustris]
MVTANGSETNSKQKNKLGSASVMMAETLNRQNKQETQSPSAASATHRNNASMSDATLRCNRPDDDNRTIKGKNEESK